MVKELEKAGFPIVIICNLTPVAKTVGANRIVPAFSIPYPLGNPQLSEQEEHDMRMNIVKKALGSLTERIDEQRIF